MQDPREDDRKKVDQLRDMLTAQFELLDRSRQQSTGIVVAADEAASPEDPSVFDDPDAPEKPTHERDRFQRDVSLHNHDTDERDVLPVERRRLAIPSTCSALTNPYQATELTLRLQQAEKTIHLLREAIADKSFQYSHVIRVAPTKHVRTRARDTIVKLTNAIAFYSRIYARCRAAMVTLGASDTDLARYQILLKDHVKSSSALLNPNEPGASRLRLSWIWQSNMPGNNANPSSLRECESFCSRLLSRP